MKPKQQVLIYTALSLALASPAGHAGWGDMANDLMKQATEATGTGTQSSTDKGAAAKPAASSASSAAGAALGAGLGNTEIASGLKEALSKGTKYAVETLGKQGGFANNPLVKIEPPASLSMVDQALRAAGKGELVDEFVGTMNQAAEKAVPEAADVLSKSISQMSMDDAAKLLNGGDEAATDYFRSTSTDELKQRFLPIVKQATDSVGVTQSYKRLTAGAGDSIGQLAGGLGGMLGGDSSGIPTSLDLDEYITERTLDGLFKVIAEQEKQIRANPAQRTTELLKTVFGG